ncbi:hypothetical protein ACFL21_04030 [Patescibacteria group bacterium]
MRKPILLLMIVLLLTSCSPQKVGSLWALSKYYYIDTSDQRLYIEGPADAKFFVSNSKGFIEFNSCKINFADFNQSILNQNNYKEGLESQPRSFGNHGFEALFKENRLVLYIGHEEDNNLVFWAEDTLNGVDHCVNYLEFLVDSITDNTTYVNEKFGITFELPHNYLFSDFQNGQGIRLVKHQIGSDGKNYDIEIVVYAFQNYKKIQSVEEYLAMEFPDYQAETVDYWGRDSAFINLNREMDTIRQYYTMGFDKSYIYGTYLKAPPEYFYSFLQEFEMLVREINFFK